ncbi:MAG: hypothetical protein U9Q79_04765 [Candidatus Hydrogenedentes bacterium]|nr:hypothetical protein [Candidatus Hydrogenedentota bacterium]
MPITFTIDRDRGFALFRGTALVTLDDFLETFDAYSKAGSVNLELYDFRAAETHLTGEEIRTLAMLGASKSVEREPGSKTALLVASSTDYGLSRMYQLLGEFEGVSWALSIFRDPEEAYAWLGLPESPPA